MRILDGRHDAQPLGNGGQRCGQAVLKLEDLDILAQEFPLRSQMVVQMEFFALLPGQVFLDPGRE